MPNFADLVVVGGGAAGFFGAIAAAEDRHDLKIVILEKAGRPLIKLGISGGGRCNVTHACFDPAELCEFYPRGRRELHGPFTRFQPKDIIAWFETRQVPLKIEADGRVFPISNQSESIIDCFFREIAHLGIELHTACTVKSIVPAGSAFELILENGSSIGAAAILMAPGGGSKTAYALAEGLGHTIILPMPSLFSIKISDPRLSGLAGISTPNAELRLLAGSGDRANRKGGLTATGSVLVTHWGLSGPAVLTLSAWGARVLGQLDYQADIQINWVHPRQIEEVLSDLKELKGGNPKKLVQNSPPYPQLSQRLWNRLAAAAGISTFQPWADISNQQLQILTYEICAGIYPINGRAANKDEFVTSGGISLKEVDFQTMQSRIHPGLYFAGEYLDIDGLTGGYNFQAAWTTGWIAGKAAAARFNDK